MVPTERNRGESNHVRSRRTLVLAPLPPKSPTQTTSSPCLLQIGGLSLLRRTLLLLRLLGADPLAVVFEGSPEPLLADLAKDKRLRDIPLYNTEEGLVFAEKAPFLLVFADRLLEAELLKDLPAEDPPHDGVQLLTREGEGNLLERFSGVSICGPGMAAKLGKALNEGAGPLPERWLRTLEGSQVEYLPAEDACWVAVASPDDIPRAEERLFRELGKKTDSFLARRLDRPISLAMTRRFARTSITPNQMTLATLLLGLLSAGFIAQPLWGFQVIGALLFMFTSTLDGCDGEIARLKFQQTRLGGWLDLWADNLVHVAVFGGIAAGLYWRTPEPRFIWLGALACLGVLLSAGGISWKTLRNKSGKGDFFVSVVEGMNAPKVRGDLSWLARLADYLTRRDFSYLILILAVAGRLEWFLWASAIGGNLFFLTLVFLWTRLGSTRPAHPTA